MTEQNDRVSRKLVIDAFPELDEIVDEGLREKVVRVWITAIRENGYDSIQEMPWGAYHDDIHGERQVDHIREVTQHAISMADMALAHRPDLDLDRDVVVASALLHDVSKLYEMSSTGDGFSEIGEMIPHPVMCNYLFHKHDVPVSIQHNVLAHTHQMALQPRTVEGQIIKIADIVALEALSWEHRRRPHNVIETRHYDVR